jgi:sugar phosphate isomerase/epimerase
MEIHIAAYRELADYAATRDVTMLVENYGWMQGNPRSVVELVTAIGKNVFACPDIGNWNTNEIRYEALKETFPSAVSCDFKARELGPDGEHRKYDLRRCYDIGRQAGFKGPWCLEHAHRDRKTLFHDLGLLRDQLRQWMRSSE